MKITVQVYQARDGWRWRMKRSGRIVADSGEAYSRRSGARKAVAHLLEAIMRAKFKLQIL